MVDPEYLVDKKVQKIDADIRSFKVALQKTRMDLESLDSRLDQEIAHSKSVAKSKRETYETLKSQLKHAEEEWKRADRAYNEAKKKKDKERSNLRKEVEKIEKRIRDAEKAKEKRFKELDKEKEKLVEKAKREKAREMEEEKAREMARVEREKRRELGLD
ncbi:MAG: hypothetical protein ACP6KW_04065 [Candidatus Thorarchaeota archaeon]